MKLVIRPMMPKLDPLVAEIAIALMANITRLNIYKMVNL